MTGFKENCGQQRLLHFMLSSFMKDKWANICFMRIYVCTNRRRELVGSLQRCEHVIKQQD
jgi:hypothetical protein